MFLVIVSLSSFWRKRENESQRETELVCSAVR